MKPLFYLEQSSVKHVAGLAAVLLLSTTSVLAVLKHGEMTSLPNVDVRSVTALSAAEMAARKNGLTKLQSQVPGLSVSYDHLLQTPKFVNSRTVFLTGTNGSGLGVSAATVAGYAPGDGVRSLKAFLDEHADLYGHGAEALGSAVISRDAVTAHNGLRTVVYQQTLDGLPVFESVIVGNITAKGELASVAGGFVPNAAAAASAGTPNRATLQVQPTISAPGAIVAAAQSLGDQLSPDNILLAGNGGAGFQKFRVNNSDAHVRPVWLPLNRSNLRLGWEVIARSQATRLRYQLIVDAETGAVLLRRSLTKHISDATYNVYTSDSPSPFTPGHQTPSAVQPALVNRTLLTLSALDVTASPNGWINDGDNETRGNNTDTFVDRDFDGQPDGGGRPQGNPNRVFDFPLDLTQAPVTYSNAATVQMFYWVNWYHDRLYQLGFTESAGNYQTDNFGRGGLGGDEILSYVQAAADLGAANNAFFSVAPDGISGEIAMFIWDFPTPNRDGDLDAEVILHEATHGTSWRLVGGGMGLGTLQSDGMGEGWSDFYALSLLSEASDNPDAVYGYGGYVTYQLGGLTENYYFGIRNFPYTTDMNKNPFTFKDIDPTQISSHPGVPRSPISPFDADLASEVHHQGEIWCSILWEVRANLVRKHGFAGNELMLQLVTDGMKLTPAAPTYIEARDAILLADLVSTGGDNYLEIWRGFAKRGLGYGATAPASTTTTGVRESFDLPGLQVAGALVFGGNGNEVVDYNECNDLFLVLTNLTPTGITNVTVTIASTTPGVAIGVRSSPYPDMPAGGGGTNLVAFTLSTAPFFVCGAPIDFIVTIKSDELTSATPFRLNTGSAGTPVQFDSTGSVAIADLDSVGTNSVITVTNIVSAINKVTVSLYLTHTYDSDIYFELVGPDGTTVMLSDHNGGSGNNYGASCSPETFRTAFDDDAASSITGGAAPFVGTFQPQEPLAAFIGKAGTNVNGNWTLHVVDDVGLDIGVLQCWSLFLSAATCTDGGGACPGAELGIGMLDTPDPVFIGSNLVYTISITNNGPSEAKGMVVNHVLPPSVVFVSGFASQGSVTHSGGTVVANIGTVPFGSTATVTVNVIPTLAGTINSSATVSSNESDPDTSNNSVNITTRVNPPAADIAVGLFDAPDPALVGDILTYTVSVTNNGPSTASGVMVTNTLHVSTPVQAASASQGAATINGNVVVFNFGALTNTGRATGTISVIPTATGSISATAVARANQADPVQVNNTSVATTTVGPAADLVLTLTDLPDPAVVGANWIYTVTVTNTGPSAATAVVINQTVSEGVSLSATATMGTPVISGNLIATTIPSLASGAGLVITVTANTASTNTVNSFAIVTAAEADPNPADNAAAVNTLVATPFVSIVPAGATLTAESFVPADGAISAGETVTVQLRLRNAGNVNNTNLTATLLATNGVTAPNPATAVSYGVLPAGGLSVAQPFTFTAAGTNGGTITAVLQLRDNGNLIGTATYDFVLPIVRSFTNPNYIAITDDQPVPWIAGPALPYPSTITVSGLTGLVGKVTVTLSNFSHSVPDDVDMLLVGPSGQKVILMSDAGGFNSVANLNVTFDDAASSVADEGQILSGSYHPANYEGSDSFNSPAPGGPYQTSLATFAGSSANGIWSLYIMDDSNGDPGSVANGWSLSFTAIAAVNQIADLGLTASANPSSGLIGNSVTTIFTVTNAGPNAAAGVVLTNIVPASATLLSAGAAQGSVTTNGNTVLANLGTLAVGATRTVTVIVVPGVGTLTNATTGVLISPASVGTTDTDLNSGNNSVSAIAVVALPVADIAVTQSVATNVITLNSNVTFAINVTNAGPQTALNVVVTDPLPAGFNFVSTSAISYTNASGHLTIMLGSLAAGSASSFNIIATATTTGLRTNTVAAATDSSDTNSVNNSSALALSVLAPAPGIVAAGQVITSESGVVNGAVDLGEQVTVSLTLKNIGTADTTNLRATLLATGGVSSPSGPQSYGVLTMGGAAGAQSFTFTAPNVNGGVVVATLALKDEKPGVTNDLGTVAFVFNLPGTHSFTNAAGIAIPASGPATPYPATITVSGVTGVVNQVSVRLNGFSHVFPDDVDVLLVGPAGQKVLLMSDAGGGYAVSGLNLTFSDGNQALPDAAALATAINRPTDYETAADVFPSPVPAGPTATTLAAFKGSAPNGNWSLYVVDDATGDAGSIGGGWTLTLDTVSVVNPLADLAVSITSAPDAGAPNPPFVGSAVSFTITVVNNGPGAATGVVVSDTLPGGLSYASSFGSQGSIGAAGNVVTWSVGSLASSGSAVATVRSVTSVGGSIVNTVTASGGQTDLNLANNAAEVSTIVRVPVKAVLSEVTLTNATLQFTLTGDPGMSYKILTSTNLTTWTVRATNTAAVNGTIKFTDPAVTDGQRFYRAERVIP